MTGGGRGIGARIARELTDAGMRVAVSGRTQAQVDAVAAEIGGLALVGDVSRHADVEAWVERVESELGPIALLVNNAGIGGSGRGFLEEAPEEWWRVFEVNVLGAYLCCRVVAPRREAARIPNIDVTVREGDVVQVGSLVGRVMETPGHTAGHISYWFKQDKLAFVGDTLFSVGCGRIIEGNPEMMWNSLLKIRNLPGRQANAAMNGRQVGETDYA